jgi:DNA-binding response OmpR family regulator
MKKEPVIIITEDDDGHLGLILYRLKKEGITNKILQFEDGEQTLNFLFKRGDGPYREDGVKYILLLDIRLPGIDGIEVLRQLKKDKWVNNIPVIMVSTMDNPEEIDKCKKLGCDSYFVKSPTYNEFSHTMEQLGHYIKTVIFPVMDN